MRAPKMRWLTYQVPHAEIDVEDANSVKGVLKKCTWGYKVRAAHFYSF